ncbi:MAG TPA: hypothetical protein VIM73_18220 [Polyangiaceae bacterium]
MRCRDLPSGHGGARAQCELEDGHEGFHRAEATSGWESEWESPPGALPPETRLAMLDSLAAEERGPRWAEARAEVVAKIDHVVTRPVLHWAQLWQDMAKGYAQPPEQILVMLTGQTHAKDNGPWLVRVDGSHRRPEVM